ncbi:MAG: ABC transporter substrate-binding protein [Nocardioides sp.]
MTSTLSEVPPIGMPEDVRQVRSAQLATLVDELTRRTLLIGGLGASVTLGLSSCGDTEGSRPTTSVEPGFPARVTHKFGTTIIPTAPIRVVSAGSCTQDYLLAVGVIPVAITDWYGHQPDATWPWAHPRLRGAHPAVLTADDGFEFEKIAVLGPDLIVATNDGMTAADYAKLSAIAPTIPQSGRYRNYYDPWDVQTIQIGTALGRPDHARGLVAGIKSRFASERRSHPELHGTTVVFLQNAVSDGSVIASPAGFATEFLTGLGLVVPPQIAEFAQDAQAYIPLEQLSVLNSADVLIWATEEPSDQAALQHVPGFQQLHAVRAGRSIYTGGTLSGAIYFDSPLSLPYVLDHLVPELAEVLT